MRVYLCSSLRPEVVARVKTFLDDPRNRYVSFFCPRGTDRSQMMDFVREDVREIERCDEVWVVGQFGRDCSWEIGFAMGIGKKIKMFRDQTNQDRIDADWMYRIGFERGLLEIIDL